ncbi:MAG: hypothetical protein M3350_00800 [Actinomycetota bacterium]|nr:hypothetical protein [Actinomycetota bacterium]
MIDLHCHILPGLDDGPEDLETSLEMARVAVAEGIERVVATPHIDLVHGVVPEQIVEGVAEVNSALRSAGIPLSIIPGAEIALPRVGSLDDDELRALSPGRHQYLLVESPYSRATGLLEQVLFDLRIRGFHPILAHPERCPDFQQDTGRLEALVEQGVLCSVDSGSIVGQFGKRVQRFAIELFRGALVHNVASDAHDPVGRPPLLRTALESAERAVPGIAARAEWFTSSVPAAIVAGETIPHTPAPANRARSSRHSS